MTKMDNINDDALAAASAPEEPEAERDAQTPVDEERIRLERERQEYLEGWQRAKADFINYKKDEAKRLEEFAKYQSEGFLRNLITVLDSFDLGIAALEKQGNVEKGIYMIRTQIEDLLRTYGVAKIGLARGAPFDPVVAEAVAAAESEEVPDGHVLEEIEPGYKLREKVIRPARVKVSKGKPQEP